MREVTDCRAGISAADWQEPSSLLSLLRNTNDGPGDGVTKRSSHRPIQRAKSRPPSIAVVLADPTPSVTTDLARGKYPGTQEITRDEIFTIIPAGRPPWW